MMLSSATIRSWPKKQARLRATCVIVATRSRTRSDLLLRRRRMPRGGRRGGSGRPTSAAREDAAEKAAAKIVGALKDADPYTALRRVLAYHDKAFAECAAKLPFANRTNAFLLAKDMQAHSLAIRLTVEQLSKFPAPQPDTPQCVIRAPEICATAEEWTARYRPAPDAPEKPAASPEIEKLRVAAEALADPQAKPRPRLVVDNDPQPPLASIMGPCPPTEIPMEFWADCARRRGR